MAHRRSGAPTALNGAVAGGRELCPLRQGREAGRENPSTTSGSGRRDAGRQREKRREAQLRRVARLGSRGSGRDSCLSSPRRWPPQPLPLRRTLAVRMTTWGRGARRRGGWSRLLLVASVG
jgi:hypothetical protein